MNYYPMIIDVKADRDGEVTHDYESLFYHQFTSTWTSVPSYLGDKVENFRPWLDLRVGGSL